MELSEHFLITTINLMQIGVLITWTDFVFFLFYLRTDTMFFFLRKKLGG
jgi:hypothetical protein